MPEETKTQETRTQPYRQDIDGLRGLAVLSVVAFHVAPKGLMGGYAGVDVFFVISGFLIAGLILRSLEDGRFSFSGFYLARVRRIFPALVLTLAASAAAGWLLLFPDEFRELGKHVLAGTLSVENLLLWGESGYFDRVSSLKPLLHLWSLGIEEQFYLAFPLFVFLLHRLGRKSPGGPGRIVAIAVSAAFAASLALNLLVPDGVARFYLPLTRAWELLAGVLVAVFSVFRGPALAKKALAGSRSWLARPVGGRQWRPLGALSAFLGLAMVLLAVAVAADDHGYPIWRTFLAVLGTVLFLLAGAANPVSRLVLANGPMRYVGLVSYPLYLWHWPMVALANTMTFGARLPGLARLAIVLVSLALSALTHRLVERPIRFSAAHRGKKHVGLLVSMALMGLLGLSVWTGIGPGARAEGGGYPPEVFREFAQAPPTTDEGCLGSLGFKPYRSVFCRLSQGGSGKTMAIFGDSHAVSVFPGLAALNARKGLGTLALGLETQIRPMVGADRIIPRRELRDWRDLTERYYRLLEEDRSIEIVLLVLRFSQESASQDRLPPDPASDPGGRATALDLYAESIQKSVDRLTAAGKKVYVLADWPGLATDPRGFLGRPLRGAAPLPARGQALE
ncbi:MAG: acyltransferase, partial [Deltaproteobacteria bacterium]|nr:acyltransferase [Deltaproteobacteria bacterium]